ncbi:MAG: hypothetical protein ACRDMZ_05965, partial [Solirubrobacteraceae bacterium]
MKRLHGLLLGAALVVGARSDAAPEGAGAIEGAGAFAKTVAALTPTRLTSAPKLDRAIATYFGT